APSTAAAAPGSAGAATSAADAAPAAATASDSTALGTVDEVERLRRSGPSALRTYDDAAALLAEFRAVLDECLMGTRVYVAGPESFIGPALRIALDFNLNKDEIRAEALGTLSRRVYCVHCQATTDGVRTNIAQCAGCNRWLLVRDHYSRRLAAYMGVMVDAEAPGELPEIREVFA
ncbi:MAG: dimethylamine monooxygenase subunit, partial [Gammaproteobacteria bacterium]|nr:dimethylamine monooxygenase subunit [Gammaproteobacteria bacterium]